MTIEEFKARLEASPEAELAETFSFIKSKLEDYITALQEIAKMPEDSIWMDDRDDAADTMVRIARKALGVEE